MFGYLKKKLGDVVSKFSKKVEEEAVIVDNSSVIKDEAINDSVDSKEKVKAKSKEKVKESIEEKTKTIYKSDKEKLKEKKTQSTKSKESDIDFGLGIDDVESDAKGVDVGVKEVGFDVGIESDEGLETKSSKTSGFFSKISDTFTKFKLSDERFEELFWDLEVALLENNVALEVIQKIKDDLKEELTQDKISRKKASDIILGSLHKSLKEVLSVEKFDLMGEINKKKPYIITVIGVNGSGKTTTIAKLCNYLKKQNKSIVLAAADTFRAAAIQQIEYHANNLGIKLIKHEYNSDPSAVAFDAIRHAESKGLDVVIIDTAGRLHSNDNLMNELKKLVRVNNPDLKLFVGESITGNDCVEQAKKYDEIIGIDAIILSKADIDDKGGAALSISYVTKKPVLFIGTGQEYDDLEEYDKEKILSNLGI